MFAFTALKHSAKASSALTGSRRYASFWDKKGSTVHNPSNNAASAPATGGNAAASPSGFNSTTNTSTPAYNNNTNTNTQGQSSSSADGFSFKNLFGGSSGSSAPKRNLSSEKELEIVKEKFNFVDVPTRYAYLFYSSFQSEKAIDALPGQVAKLEQLYKDDFGKFQQVIDDPLLSNKQRSDLLAKIIEDGKLHPVTEAFLAVLSQQNRITDLPDILDELDLITKRLQQASFNARVVSAAPLEAAQRSEIQNVIKQTFDNVGAIELKEEVDPSIGAGYELFVEDEFHLDNTQRTASAELQEIIEESVQTYLQQTTEAEDAQLAAARLVDTSDKVAEEEEEEEEYESDEEGEDVEGEETNTNAK